MKGDKVDSMPDFSIDITSIVVSYFDERSGGSLAPEATDVVLTSSDNSDLRKHDPFTGRIRDISFIARSEPEEDIASAIEFGRRVASELRGEAICRLVTTTSVNGDWFVFIGNLEIPCAEAVGTLMMVSAPMCMHRA